VQLKRITLKDKKLKLGDTGPEVQANRLGEGDVDSLNCDGLTREDWAVILRGI